MIGAHIWTVAATLLVAGSLAICSSRDGVDRRSLAECAYLMQRTATASRVMTPPCSMPASCTAATAGAIADLPVAAPLNAASSFESLLFWPRMCRRNNKSTGQPRPNTKGTLSQLIIQYLCAKLGIFCSQRVHDSSQRLLLPVDALWIDRCSHAIELLGHRMDTAQRHRNMVLSIVDAVAIARAMGKRWSLGCANYMLRAVA